MESSGLPETELWNWVGAQPTHSILGQSLKCFLFHAFHYGGGRCMRQQRTGEANGRLLESRQQWRTPSPRAAPAPQLYRHPCSKSTSSRDDPPAQVPSLTQAAAQSDTIGTDHCRWPHHLKPICAFHPHKEPKADQRPHQRGSPKFGAS